MMNDQHKDSVPSGDVWESFPLSSPSVSLLFFVSRVTTAPSAVLQACTEPIAPRRVPVTTRSPAHTSTAPASAEKVRFAQ